MEKQLSFTETDGGGSEPRGTKRVRTNGRGPPGQVATVDNQSSSELCVRFALAKAVANQLYVREKIDIEQDQIVICLVQALGEQFGIDAVNPMVYNGKVLYLQDRENDLPKPAKCPKCSEDEPGIKSGVPHKSWWKVRLNYIKMKYAANLQISNAV